MRNQPSGLPARALSPQVSVCPRFITGELHPDTRLVTTGDCGDIQHTGALPPVTERPS
ncbi:MAG: hypothetical protein OXU20_00840 [Myxococcales bacterium]|nr:hypothetical protein [Myxococcales bacterium]